MSNVCLSDEPVESPDEDLLGMHRYCLTLAELIRSSPPPLTVGIYGDWGSGKSTFVNLVRHFLAKSLGAKLEFIPFGAWPHRTADDLWRALILKIAGRMYNVPEPPAKAAPAPAPPAPGGLGPWLGRFLNDTAVVLREPPPEVDPLADYYALLARLDRTPYCAISKQAGQRFRPDEEETMLAILKAALEALGSMSPLVAAVRGLFGKWGEIDPAAVLRREKNEAARDRVQSVIEFQEILKDLFKEKADGRTFCVFVDDLDRCLPDVALDLLEAIKIFFGQKDFPCVFLVAADQNLIGMGLAARYREMAGDSEMGSRGWLAQKGQEYFEKIIQLAVPLPAPTLDQLHAFVAGQFPRRAAMHDLIQIVAGDNPRRLKQQCHWLTYNYLALREG